MAEITRFFFWRHLRGEPNFQILHHKGGRPIRSGPGESFWFYPLSASIAEVPLDDRDLPFHFQGRSRDFQNVTAQGVITFRISDPNTLAKRVDFTVDLDTGTYAKEPLEKLSLLLTQLAQQFALDYIAHTPVREILANGIELLRTRIGSGLSGDEQLGAMGIEVVTVRIASVRPTADLEKALQMPTREAIQQASDEATFQRRALAVEKERAIEENELKNKIELARREEVLIEQRGQNEQRRMTEEMESLRVEADAKALRDRLRTTTNAEAIKIVEGARVEAERERMDIYRDLPTPVIIGLAAQELAGKLKSIDHLNVSPDMFGPLITNLVQAGTRKLETKEE